jgi:hypothetical protein
LVVVRKVKVWLILLRVLYVLMYTVVFCFWFCFLILFDFLFWFFIFIYIYIYFYFVLFYFIFVFLIFILGSFDFTLFLICLFCGLHFRTLPYFLVFIHLFHQHSNFFLFDMLDFIGSFTLWAPFLELYPVLIFFWCRVWR